MACVFFLAGAAALEERPMMQSLAVANAGSQLIVTLSLRCKTEVSNTHAPAVLVEQRRHNAESIDVIQLANAIG